jgi:hypothetical protein
MLMPVGLNPGSYSPFTADNKLDAKALERELKLVAPGSGGLHGPAGHSEFASLTSRSMQAIIVQLSPLAPAIILPA